MRLSALPIEAAPAPTSYYVVIRDNGDGTFTDVKVLIKNSFYQKLKATYKQSGTNAPVNTDLVNTLLAALTLARTGAGTYTITSATPIFTADKTFLKCGPGITKFERTSTSVLTIETGGVDGVLNETAIDIEIYP